MHEHYRLGVYENLGSAEATAGLSRDLFTFAWESEAFAEGEFVTFVSVFRQPTDSDEQSFERLLWTQLHKLNLRDAPLFNWDASVSNDAEIPHFAFSFAETAFFVVGLHPDSSRAARRFPWPALVFNPHAQFEHLKQEGRWERLRDVIRAREEELQGCLNPNLAEHGAITEARQYSGRKVEPGWHPPFTPVTPDGIRNLSSRSGISPVDAEPTAGTNS